MASASGIGARSVGQLVFPLQRVLIVVLYVGLFWALLPLALWALGTRLDAWLMAPSVPNAVRALGAVLAALAAGPLLRAMWLLLRRGRGLPISHLPPTHLVDSGLYRRVRHPIYVAFNLGWFGLSLALGSWGAALGGGLVLCLAWIGYALSIEDPRLRERFGSAYLAYAESTPLLPIPAWPARGAARLWCAIRPSLSRLANHTVLLRGSHWTLVSYGAFVGGGAGLMALWSGASLNALGIAPADFGWFALSVAVAMLFGGRLLGLAYRPRLLLRSPLRALRTVGFVSWGGYLGLAMAAAAGARTLGLPLGAVFDRLVLPGLVCSAIGRLGCLSYGCCGGRPWRHGILWRNPEARIVRELGEVACVPRVPTQLLSGGWALCVVALLWWPSTLPLPAGALTATGCLLYALGRFAIESTREEASYSRLGLTRGQFASLAVAAVALGGVLSLAARPYVAVHGPALGSLPWSSALGCSLLCLLVAGLHGRRVGHW